MKTAIAEPTIASVDADLRDTDNLRETLESERDQLTAVIAGNLRGDTSVQEQRLASVNAKLQSLPVLIGNLQTTRETAERSQALADYEGLSVTVYDLYAQIAACDAEIKAHYAAIETTNKQRADLMARVQSPRNKRVSLFVKIANQFKMQVAAEAINRKYSVPPYM